MKKPLRAYLKNLFLLGREEELPRHQKVESGFRGLIHNGKVPGMVVCLNRGGKAILRSGYGYACLETETRPDPGNTLFRIASISKPIAATALLHLVAEGYMALDASYYEYVPYFPAKEYDFTIRQLAAHTAGIRGYRGKEYALNRPMSIRESLKIFQDDPLLFKPGTAYHYNSYGWVMLSLAMEEATGLPFPRIVREKVLDPLGMQHTLPDSLQIPSAERAAFYSPRKGGGFRPAIPVNTEYKLAGGGYLSTADDILRFGQAYLERKMGPPELVDQFLSRQPAGESRTWYGLGWEVSRDSAGRAYYGHTGSSVGAYSIFRVYPESEVVFVCLINCSDPGVGVEIEEILATVIP